MTDLTRIFGPAGFDASKFAPPPARDPIAEFAEELAKAGFVLDGLPVADGEIHRVKDGPNDKSRTGWYVLYLDRVATGVYGTWHDPDSRHVWEGHHGTLSAQEAKEHRDLIQATLRRAQEERESRHSEAAAVARQVLSACREASESHPYLAAKGVGAHGVSEDSSGRLVIPRYDADGLLWSYQTIDRAGAKLYQADGRAAGTFFLLGKPGKTVHIAEGYATAATVFAALGGGCVAVAFDAGNLKKVGLALRAKYPGLQIVFAADNDTAKAGNPGLTAARNAAQACAGTVLAPEFPVGATGKDWNDLGKLKGLEEVKRQLGVTGDPLANIPMPPTLDEFMALAFPPQSPLLGPFKTQQLVLIAAPPGVGKTMFGLSLSDALSRGENWGHWRAPLASSVLYIDGEMTGESVQNRLRENSKRPRQAPFGLVNCVNWVHDLGLDLGHPNIADPRWQRVIERWAEPYQVIFLDNVMSLVYLEGVSMSSDEFWRAAHSWAVRMRARGKTIFIFDHTNAEGQVFGTKTKIWAVDFYLTLSKPTDEDNLSADAKTDLTFNLQFEKIRGDQTPETQSVQITYDVSQAVPRVVPLRDRIYAQIQELMSQGLSQRNIAEELKLSKSSLNRIIKKYEGLGIKPEPWKGRPNG